MDRIKDAVAIQFIQGKDERDLPEIRLFRNNDGKKGKALYKFYNPSTISLENFNSIKKMYLIDEEGILSTTKVDLTISDNNIIEVISSYNWNSEKEFERYMRFAKRYASSLTNF